jgi:hypothetical protein
LIQSSERSYSSGELHHYLSSCFRSVRKLSSVSGAAFVALFVGDSEIKTGFDSLALAPLLHFEFG